MKTPKLVILMIIFAFHTQHVIAAKVTDLDPDFLAFVAAVSEQQQWSAQARLEELGERLKITDEQQPLWQAFSARMMERGTAAKRLPSQGQMTSSRSESTANRLKNKTAVELMSIRVEQLENRLQNTIETRHIIESLYDALDEKQRQQFDHAFHRMLMRSSQAIRGKHR